MLGVGCYDYGVLIVLWEQFFLWEPFVVYVFIWKYPLTYVGYVLFVILFLSL